MPRRALLFGYWAGPALLALAVYFKAFHCWFQEDDFVWLKLVHDIHSWEDLRYALFHPTIHGTWRPLGERIYFVVVQTLFGPMSATPFRVVAIGWQCVNLALLSAITLRITHSRIAGFIAPILWISSDKQVMLMVWNSDINYIACAFYLLLALWCLIRYTESGGRGYLIGMWASFLCSLGALEMAVTFPAIAAAYLWVMRDREKRGTGAESKNARSAASLWRIAGPLFAASAIFAVLHKIYVPDQAAGPYHMQVDSAIFSTLAQYWSLALIPQNLSIFTRFPEAAGTIAMALFSIALLGYVAFQATRRNWIPAMFLAWFVMLLGVVLPLRNHVTDYYVALPLIGLAMLAGDAIGRAWAQPVWFWRAAGLALAALFLAEMLPVAYRATAWNETRSSKVRTMVLAVNALQKKHPDTAILLDGLDNDLFWAGIQNRCFGFLGYDEVFIDAASLPFLEPHPEVNDPAKFVLPAAQIQERAQAGKLTLYQWTGSGVIDQTATLGIAPVAATATTRNRVDVGDAAFADRLSGDWFGISEGSRWMSKRAAVRLSWDGSAGHQLRISGYSPAILLAKGPLHLTLSINGRALPAVTIDKPDAFEFQFPLRAGLPRELEVGMEVDRTIRVPPDQRDLGLVFGVLEIQ